MLISLLAAIVLFSTTNALTCYHNGTIVNEVYQGPILVSASSHSFEFGYVKCAGNLNRCVDFKTMDIAYFKTLDVGKDSSDFSNVVSKSEGKVKGRCCMSQTDVDKIQAKPFDSCIGHTDTSCYCSTDECTGASGMALILVSMMSIMIYSIARY